MLSRANTGNFLDYLIKNHETIKDANKEHLLDISKFKEKFQKKKPPPLVAKKEKNSELNEVKIEEVQLKSAKDMVKKPDDAWW